jgi:RNA polymerase sigma-54 factor
MMKLEQRVTLQQKLTPQLIQSLHLLQLPTLELEQFIRQELVANPILETEEDTLSPDEDGGEEPEPMEASEAPEKELEFEEGTISDEGTLELLLKEGYDLGYDLREPFDPSYEPRENTVADTHSFSEMLLQQLHLSTSADQDTAIGEYIIGNLDDDGFLACSVDEIAETFQVPAAEVERVLQIVQGFDPPGVAARDLRECLMIQMRERGLDDTAAARIVEGHLEDLKRHRYSVITRSLGITEQDIRDALEIIGSLNPKPAAASSPGVSDQGIVPELTVEEIEGEFVVLLNDSVDPSLRISPAYRSMAYSKSVPEETRKFLLDKIHSANWLIKSIHQRRSTMLKVMGYIVSAQSEFFRRGPGHLRPMVLQDVADAVELHPSTISRVTSGKYVQTPYGVFELKYFFDSKLSTTKGNDISAKSVRGKIAGIVANEDAKHPLSDDQIGQMLRDEGINVARRTVAKYRALLGINPARYREQV